MRFPWLFATILVQFLVKTESKKLLFVKYNNSVSRSGSIRRLRPSDFPTGIKIFRQTTLRGPVGGWLPCPPSSYATEFTRPRVLSHLSSLLALKHCDEIIKEGVALYHRGDDVIRAHKKNAFFSGRAKEYFVSKVVDRVHDDCGRCPFLAANN